MSPTHGCVELDYIHHQAITLSSFNIKRINNHILQRRRKNKVRLVILLIMLPPACQETLTWLESHALKESDVFSGKPCAMTLVKDLYAKASSSSSSSDDPEEAKEDSSQSSQSSVLAQVEDVKLVFAVLVLGLREMPKPLVPFELYAAVLDAAKVFFFFLAFSPFHCPNLHLFMKRIQNKKS